MLRTRRTRSEKGAAAVEAGLLSTMLFPLMVGVLFWGNYFWKAQSVDIYAARPDPNSIVGVNFTCNQLTDLVKQQVLDNINALGDPSIPPVSLQDISASVVQVLPTAGAYVHVSVSVPVVDQFTSLLPNGGRVIQEMSFRLDNVTLTTDACY